MPARRIEEGEPCERCGSPRVVWHTQSQGRGGTWSCGPCRTATERKGHLRRAYGITEEKYNAMFAQQAGCCAICLNDCVSGQWLSVDHDHTTGAVRGLLCHNCNKGLGCFNDDVAQLRAAIKYLQAGSENA